MVHVACTVEKVDLPPNATKGNTYAVAMYSGKKDVLSEANSSSSWKEDNKIYLEYLSSPSMNEKQLLPLFTFPPRLPLSFLK